MKIAYVLTWDLSSDDGVTKKVRNQTVEWARAGCLVRTFCFGAKGRTSAEDGIRNYPKGFTRLSSGPRRFFRDLSRFKPDIVYLRHEHWKPYHGRLCRRYKVVTEINSDEVSELALVPGFFAALRRLYAVATRGFLLSRVEAMVYVTRELAESTRFARYGKRYFVAPNSINAGSIPQLKRKNGDGPIGCVFMGNPSQKWNGIDKLVRLADAMGDGYFFHFVGVPQQPGNHPNCRFHGFLRKESYYSVLSECSIAFGTLAFHRKRVTEACTLKVREYLAAGFPTIIAHMDTAFGDKEPEWLLKIPNHEHNLDDSKIVSKIRDFCVRMRDRVVVKEESSVYIDTSVWEKRKVEFLNSLLPHV